MQNKTILIFFIVGFLSLAVVAADSSISGVTNTSQLKAVNLNISGIGRMGGFILLTENSTLNASKIGTGQVGIAYLPASLLSTANNTYIKNQINQSGVYYNIKVNYSNVLNHPSSSSGNPFDQWVNTTSDITGNSFNTNYFIQGINVNETYNNSYNNISLNMYRKYEGDYGFDSDNLSRTSRYAADGFDIDYLYSYSESDGAYDLYNTSFSPSNGFEITLYSNYLDADTPYYYYDSTLDREGLYFNEDDNIVENTGERTASYEANYQTSGLSIYQQDNYVTPDVFDWKYVEQTVDGINYYDYYEYNANSDSWSDVEYCRYGASGLACDDNESTYLEITNNTFTYNGQSVVFDQSLNTYDNQMANRYTSGEGFFYNLFDGVATINNSFSSVLMFQTEFTNEYGGVGYQSSFDSSGFYFSRYDNMTNALQYINNYSYDTVYLTPSEISLANITYLNGVDYYETTYFRVNNNSFTYKDGNVCTDTNGECSSSGALEDIYSTNSYITTGGSATNKSITFSEVNLNATINNIIASTLRTYNATSAKAVYGTVTDGTYQSTWSSNNIMYNVTEVIGVPGFDIRFNYTNVSNLNTIYYYGQYIGSFAHLVEIQLYNYNTASWVAICPFSDQTAMTELSCPVEDASRYISGGLVQMRLYHAATGNALHYQYIDQLVLRYTSGIGASGISGSGSNAYIPLFLGDQTLTNSKLNQSGSMLTMKGNITLTGGYLCSSPTSCYLISNWLTPSVIAPYTGWTNTSTQVQTSKIVNLTNKIEMNNKNITELGCMILNNGGKICGNTTCTIIYSPNGLTVLEACN